MLQGTNCPACGQYAENITALRDERWHYLCRNQECPMVKRGQHTFYGEQVPSTDSGAFEFETGEPWEDGHGNML